MCSIVASFDKRRILELSEINKKRGSFSYSLGYIDPITNYFEITNHGFGKAPLESLLEDDVFKYKYIIFFQQAPTNGLVQDYSRIHPAIKQDILKNLHYLYHNGIVKHEYLKKLEHKYFTSFPWDTYAILYDIIHQGLLKSLENLDASFACLYIRQMKECLIFRNQSSIIYIDDDLNISSEQFDTGEELPINQIYKLDILHKRLEFITDFKNIEDRYFFI